MSQVLNEPSFASPSGTRVILKVDNLLVTFTKERGVLRKHTSVIRAVDNVSFQIQESEILSLVGESGSGKTTVARCVTALQRPTSGSIIFDDADVTDLKAQNLKNYRRDVQIIFQDPFESIYPRQDVFTTIATPILRLKGAKDTSRLKEEVSELLVEVGLEPEVHMNRLPHQLSGGERQRVSIARALAPGPRLLVADEPITMLDASQRLNILSLLMRLKRKRNLTVLLITHDLASAKLMSDRTAVMYMGKIVELGPTKVILSKPHHPYSQLILDATPRLGVVSQDFSEFSTGAEGSANVTKGCVFRPRCKYATEICKEVEPGLTGSTNYHLAACHNQLNL